MQNRKLLFSISLIALAAIIIGLAWAEQLTLTTYYPGPYGVYKEFTTTSKTTLATNSELTDPEAKVGIGTDTPTEKLDVSGEIHATGDVCTDQGGGVCLSTAGGWQYSGVQILNNVTPPPSWQTIDLSPYGVTKRTLVLLKIKSIEPGGSGWTDVAFRPNGDSHLYLQKFGGIASVHTKNIPKAVTAVIVTDGSGKIEWKVGFFKDAVDIWLLGFSR